jgi:hypothetical protein
MKKLALLADCAASLVAATAARAGSVTLIDGLQHCPQLDMTVEVGGDRITAIG